MKIDPLQATLGDMLNACTEEHANQTAVIFKQRALTFGELWSEASRLAGGLSQLGLRKGEHLAVWLPSSIEWVLLEIAAARLGLVIVPISTRYKLQEAAYILNQSDAAALILPDRFLDVDFLGRLDQLAGGRFVGPGVPSFPRLRHVIVQGQRVPPGALPFVEPASGAPLEAGRRPSPDDPLFILYTSGTTGFPKGAMLSHRNVVYNAFHMAERMRLGPGDRLLLMPPLFHVFGCVNGVVGAFSHAASIVIQETFEPAAALQLLEHHDCSALYGTATMFQMLLQDPTLATTRRPRLRTGMIGSMPVPDTVMRGIVERLGAREICNSYGQTEASVSLLTRAEDGLDVLLRGVGPPIPGVEVQVVDPRGARVAEGEDGEICVRGPHLMIGYYNMREKTAEAVDADGWLHSGDLGRMVGAGLYQITGRIKDMYISGGLKVYPAEVENVLYQHPAVLEAAIVGMPDGRLGEVGCAFVRLRPGSNAEPDDLQAWVRQHLAGYKVPRAVRFVETFPTTANGKVQKFRLREEASRLPLGDEAVHRCPGTATDTEAAPADEGGVRAGTFGVDAR